MRITVNRTKLSEDLYTYSVEPKVESFEISLLVIVNWSNSDLLVKYARNRIGYCDSDNGFGIEYKETIDFETKIQVLNNHLLVFADNVTKKEFIISENNYHKILTQFFYAKNEPKNAEIIERIMNDK